MKGFWVIGDIHGMFDPLNFLLDFIYRENARLKDYDNKIIFLGDYIDHGPSSKQVLDLLLSLDKENVIFLAGNHEDLLLRVIYSDPDDIIHNMGNWAVNGAARTLASFFKNSYDQIIFAKDDYIYYIYDSKLEEYLQFLYKKLLQVDDKYIEFFKNLIYGYHITFDSFPPYKINFAFLHAGFMPTYDGSFDFDENFAFQQCKPRNFLDAHRFYNSILPYPDLWPIWIRNFLDKPVANFKLIHGHTPVFLTKQGKFPYFPLFWTSYGAYNFDNTLNFNDLISVNLDTGAVYGKRLSALYINEEYLFFGRKISFFQVDISNGYRNKKVIKKDVELKI